MNAICTLDEARDIVKKSLAKGERLLMFDVFGNCEKFSVRLGGHVKGTYTSGGTVTWEARPYKPLPQAFL